MLRGFSSRRCLRRYLLPVSGGGCQASVAWRSGRRLTAGVVLVVLGLLVVLVASTAMATGCTARRPEARQVSLRESRYSGRDMYLAPAQDAIRLAIAPVISARPTMKSYKGLVTYLEDRTGRPVELVLKATYGEVNELLRARKVDLALICTYAYVEGNRDFGLELLAIPQVKGKTTYRAYFITSRDGPVKDLLDLRGRTFAFTDPLSFTGRLVALYALSHLRETPESFFRAYVYTYSHDQSIKAVVEGLVDAATVSGLVYDLVVAENPEYGRKLVVFGESEDIGNPPVVVHPGLDASLKEEWASIFFTMHEDERGRQILDEMKVDRFVRPDDSSYDLIRRILLAMGMEK